MPTYKIIGKRFLRKYTAPEATPVYAAATDAARIVRELCNVPWEASAVRQAEMPPHGDENNPANREKFDAALFCAGHADNMHRAYANAAVYRYALPSAAVGKTLTGLTVRVTSDPYNAAGARVHVFTGATGEIPTNCRTVRGDGDDGQPLADGTVAAGVAPRETKTIKGQDYWYPVTAEASLAPTGGLVMQKYLFVAVVLESYGTTRGNWLEGASYADNLVSITLSDAVPGCTDGGTYDLSDEAEREFAVVSGGVMAAMPSGDSGVRALTVQRTGDDFVPTSGTAAGALYLRAQIAGVRTLDLSGGDSAATFADPFYSGAAKNVSVIPAFDTLAAKSGSTYGTVNAKFTCVTGNFGAGFFPDLPGLFVVSTNVSLAANGKKSVSNSLISVATGTDATNLVAMQAAIATDGGISGAVYMWTPSYWTGNIYIATRKRFPVTSGFFGNPLSVKEGVATVESVSCPDATWTAFDGEPIILPRWSVNSTEKTQQLFPFGFVHDATAKTITCPFVSGWTAVSYAGTVTAIRPLFSETGYVSFIVSGKLESVCGTACRNCAVVTFSSAGVPAVTVPDCDALITPDSYRNFAVSAPCINAAYPSDEFYVTGGFTTLGGAACEIAAHVTGTTVTPISLPDGTRPPEYFLVCDAAGATPGSSAFWVDAQASAGGEDVIYVAPKAAVTDEQSAFGLRRLYAALYGGSLKAPAVAAEKRPGAAFVIHGDEITVKTADGDVVAKRWGLSAAALMIPFSCPQDWAASRIRLAWGAVAATEGSRVRVWLARGKYLTAYPTNYPKDLYLGTSSRVGDWEYVGEIAPTGGAAGTATLEVKPIMTDVATLLFVAFIGQDDINPSDGMTLPRGIGTLDVDLVAGTATGLDGGFRPDITLIG